jgi:dGTPase
MPLTDTDVAAIRAQLEERERQTLRPGAALAAESRGRAVPEAEHAYRTAFQRDRDRILHTKAFRRLKGKTQVFLAPKGDHYRTRLTHTLEVAQISRTAARALSLNEDLTEAIALGHDLGHTPFGHAGEKVLNERFPGGFRHYEQSLRVVDILEARTRAAGLNLTWEVRDGILHHSRGKVVLLGGDGPQAATLEGRLVSVCDAIAYINHDVDDAIRAGVVSLSDLPASAIERLGTSTSGRIDTMVTALIQGSLNGTVAMTEDVRAATVELRTYLYRQVYPSDAIRSEIDKAEEVLSRLYDFVREHPEQVPVEGEPDAPLERRAVDWLAGMTDQYALELYRRHFLPDVGRR